MKTITKYAYLIAQSEEENATAANSIAVREAEAELNQHSIAVDKAIITAESNLANAKKAKPFSARNVYIAKTNLDKLEREQKFLKELKAELF